MSHFRRFLPLFALSILAFFQLGVSSCAVDSDGDGIPDVDDCAPDDPVYPTTLYRDGDGDGYGNTYETAFGCVTTSPPYYTALLPGDCDDTNASVYPGVGCSTFRDPEEPHFFLAPAGF